MYETPSRFKVEVESPLQGRAMFAEEEHSPPRERGAAEYVPIETLAICLGLAKPDDGVLALALPLAMVGLGLIWTRIAYSGKH